MYYKSICKAILISIGILSINACASLYKAEEHGYSTSLDGRKKARSKQPVRVSKPKRTQNAESPVTSLPPKSFSADQSFRSNIISIAKTYRGVPYRYGGTDPSGFDCSGFVHYVYKQLGMSVPRSSKTLAKAGKRKKLNQCRPGDIVLFGQDGKVQHVGIVYAISPNRIEVIHSSSSKGVIISEITQSPYWRKRIMFVQDLTEKSHHS